MRQNRLRALLTAGKPSVGTHLLSTWPTLVELVGQAGNYDYVEFTAEYAPFDLHDLDNLGRALELKDLAGHDQGRADAMDPSGHACHRLRLPERPVRRRAHRRGRPRLRRRGARRDAGHRRAARVGMRRDVGTVREGGSPAYVEALNEVVIAIMVEKRECVEDLDAILSVPGIDMVQFGAVGLLDEPRPHRPARPTRRSGRPNAAPSRPR